MRAAIIIAILIALFFAIEIGYFAVAKHFGIVDKPSKRGSSTSVVLRGGGIIFPIAALLGFILSRFEVPYFIAGLAIVSTLSFIDDVHSLSPKLRLPLQFVGMMLLLVQICVDGEPLPVWGYVLLFVVGLIVCTGAMNIFNFMDGINGITGGYSLVVLIFLGPAILTEVKDLVTSAILLGGVSITIIADLVFCFFNFRKKARCFAGDVGSVSIAFIILFVLGTIMVENRDVSWLAFLVVYGVDGCLTIIHRIMLHENISLPHRKHAFQIMANELHIPHVVVSLIYMALQSVCCILYLMYPRYITLFAEIIILSLAYVLFMKKYYHLHVESGNA